MRAFVAVGSIRHLCDFDIAAPESVLSPQRCGRGPTATLTQAYALYSKYEHVEQLQQAMPAAQLSLLSACGI